MQKELGVKAPFVTKLIKDIKPKGLVEEILDVQDIRNRLVLVTAKDSTFVGSAEGKVRRGMKKLILSLLNKDLFSYLKVLHTTPIKRKFNNTQYN